MDLISNSSMMAETLSWLPSKKKSTPSELISVEPKHCHKVLRHNAFIDSARAIDERNFELIANVDHKNEGFFFDHEIDHLPGMLTACMIRQSVLVVSHLFLGVGFNQKFTMSSFSSEYYTWAELDEPVLVRCKIVNDQYRGGVFSGATLEATLFQNGVPFASGTLVFRVFPKEVYLKLRHRPKLGHESEMG